MQKSTAWTQATTSFETALLGVLSCQKAGFHAWIEVQKNGEQDHPVKIKNPALDDPFNWTMLFGIPRDAEYIRNYRFFNDTERDLTLNWYCAFSDLKASVRYRKTGKIVKGLFNGQGVITPVRNADIDAWRKDRGLGPWEYTWVTFWKPKQDIPYWIPADIPEVFVVCYDDQPFSERESYLQLAALLADLGLKENRR